MSGFHSPPPAPPPAIGQITVTVTPDNSSPTAGCDGDNTVEYTVKICNKSFNTGYDYTLTIDSPLDRQMITDYDPSLQLTQVSSTLEQLSVTFNLPPGFCEEHVFSADVFSYGTGGTFTVSAVAVITPSGASFSGQAVMSDAPEIVLSGTQAISSLAPGTLPANGCDGTARKIRLTANAVLEIDQNYCFSNTRFIAEAGASIVVKNGVSGPSSLQLSRCKLFGCGDMWRGITVQESNSISVWRCFISDAQYGVQSQNAASASCIGSTFDRNYVGFYVPDVNGNLQLTQVVMSGNTFTCTGDLATAFSGQSPAPGLRSYAGIEANRLAILPVFSAGYVEGFFYARFSDMRNGILARNCNLVDVTRCIFENLKEVAGNDGYPHSGYGIRFERGELLRVTGWGGEPTDVPSFQTCHYAIHAEVAATEITQNAMFDTQFGVHLNNCFASLKIRNNYIESAWRGVTSFESRPQPGEIADNRFFIGGNPAIGFGAPTVAAAIGIFDYNNLTTQVYWDVHDNEINLEEAWGGMDIAFTRNARVHDNVIWMNNDIRNRAGIQLGAAANQNNVYQNEINGALSASVCEPSAGIAVVNSYADTVYCNDIFDTNYGMQFKYACSSTDLKGNRLPGSNDIGLMLGAEKPDSTCFTILVNNTVIGQQRYRGNTWDGSYNLNGARNTTNSFGAIANSRFFVYQFSPPPPRYLPPNIFANAVWFLNVQPPLGTKTYLCPPEPPEEIPTDSPTSLDTAIAGGTMGDGDFVETFRWSLKRQLLHRLDGHTDWLTGNTVMQSFYNDPANANAIAMHDFARQVGAIGNMSVNARDYMDALNAEALALFEDYEAVLEAQYSGTLDTQDSLAAAALTDSLFGQLVSRAELLQGFWNNYRANQIATASTLLSQAASLPGTAVFEANEKSVLEMALQLAVSGEAQLSAVQRTALEQVAEQCFYAGGDAVVAARNMLNHYGGPEAYNDDLLCQGGTPRHTNINSSQGLQVWPNPSTGAISVVSVTPVQKMVLFNAGGSVIREYDLDSIQETTLYLDNLPNGMYLIVATGADGYTITNKLILLR